MEKMAMMLEAEKRLNSLADRAWEKRVGGERKLG